MYGSRPSKRQRRIKPIARIGAVDVTVRYDIHGLQKARGNSNCSDECFDVLEGELLFREAAKGNFYRDNSLHVMSCAAGLPGEAKFAGVAVTGFSPRTDVYEQGFVTQISGLCSVFNNSGGAFTAGESVHVTFSKNSSTSNNPNGVPYKKVLGVLHRIEPVNESVRVSREVPTSRRLTSSCTAAAMEASLDPKQPQPHPKTEAKAEAKAEPQVRR